MDAKTAIEILQSQFVDYAPTILGCKPMSIRRCEEIAEYIQQATDRERVLREALEQIERSGVNDSYVIGVCNKALEASK